MDVDASFAAHFESFRVYQDELQRLFTDVNGPLARDLARRAILVESAAKINASQPHRPAPPGQYGGSTPGGGPAVRTGRLRASITWRFAGAGGFLAAIASGVSTALGGGETLVAEIGSNVEYALYVEMGTSRMAARPFLRPALEAAKG